MRAGRVLASVVLLLLPLLLATVGCHRKTEAEALQEAREEVRREMQPEIDRRQREIDDLKRQISEVKARLEAKRAEARAKSHP